mmetsp:Transcript_13681/g.35492  ORF Transcript_13681/g.35492 Transcript_13681/m.35492 type:complete len:198 (-) Transcript_13681:195-788(-)
MLLQMVLSTLAFSAPVQKAPMHARAAISMNFSPESQLGVLPPTGFWDPAGLATDIDEETFDAYRLAELKHGRVAQLAVIGYIVPEVFRWPGDIAPGLPFADIPNGVAAFEVVPALGWLQITFLVGAVDYYGVLGDFEAGKKNLDPETLGLRQVQELQHGRLAMLAILELLRHDSQNLMQPGFDGLDHLITGLPFLYN